jgi:hypothetical protein
LREETAGTTPRNLIHPQKRVDCSLTADPFPPDRSKRFSESSPSKKAKKYLTPDKHSPNIHLHAEEAQIASSFKGGKGNLAENIDFKHNQKSLEGERWALTFTH